IDSNANCEIPDGEIQERRFTRSGEKLPDKIEKGLSKGKQSIRDSIVPCRIFCILDQILTIFEIQQITFTNVIIDRYFIDHARRLFKGRNLSNFSFDGKAGKDIDSVEYSKVARWLSELKPQYLNIYGDEFCESGAFDEQFIREYADNKAEMICLGISENYQRRYFFHPTQKIVEDVHKLYHFVFPSLILNAEWLVELLMRKLDRPVIRELWKFTVDRHLERSDLTTEKLGPNAVCAGEYSTIFKTAL
ncbi:hypothetical protein PFISCL1PPCAC_16083, partial [Pristionchus fissidentatus]